MMKKQIKIGLLVICSATLLTACSGEETAPGNAIPEVSTESENTATDNEIKDTESAEINTSLEMDYNWYEGKRYRGTEKGSLFWIQDGKVNTSLRFLCNLSDMEIETVENETVGTGLKYFYYTETTNVNDEKLYDTIILEYYPTVDRVIITEVDNVYKTQYNCSDVYEYDSMLSENDNNQTNSENTEGACYLFDGQRFECFETVSGEDITLTVHLYYSDDSSTPSSYKGELSNGVEFWFEPYESSSDCVTYKIDCMDGTTAYLQYAPDTSEIVFTADEGTEYGNMYAYSGTYIGLPDEVEE